MIPKIIHYCWFGKNEKPEIVKKCIESWKIYCPDYKIIEWNEDNFDINMCEYTKGAYELEKWAFVSDLARLVVVYENGGIYLDTDVELKSSLDDLLKYNAWFAQDDIRYINTGLGFGGTRGNQILKELIDTRLSRGLDLTICTTIDTPIIKQFLDIKQSRQSQIVDNTLILGMNNYPKYAKHYGTRTWKDETEKNFDFSRRNYYRYKFKTFLRNPKLFNWLERNGETKLSKVVVFCTYDLLDNGILYFIKRFLQKLRKSIN